MKFLGLIITFFLINLQSFLSAQISSPISFKNQITLTPFAAFDNDPSLRIAYERKFANDKALYFQTGWMYTLYNRDQLTDAGAKNFGYMFATEFRHYLQSASNQNFYLGLRFNMSQSDLAKLFWFDTTNTDISNFRYPTRQVKQIWGTQIVGGLSFTITKHLIIDMEAGIGTSYRKVINHVPDNFGDPLFDRDLRATISNKNYDNWFTPFPYFQIHIGYGW